MSYVNIQRCVAVVAISAAVSLAGCKDKDASPFKAKVPPATSAGIDPRSKVIGVEPAGLAKETAATTSTAKSDISKAQQSSAMPMPGQANDHSTLSPMATQKPATTGH